MSSQVTQETDQFDYALQEEAHIFRRRVLSWLRTLHDNGGPVWQYRFFNDGDATIYSSCFALYLHHLMDNLGHLTSDQRQDWVSHLQELQDERTGLFIDADSPGRTTNKNHDTEHLNRQLTTFCLTALGCFDEKPLYPLQFVEQWYDKDILISWFESLNWANPWNSGNKVMFAGICLTYNYEYFQDTRAGEAMNVWFDWMDRHQRPGSGFWGVGRTSDYFYGMGGFYHQYVVYNHWNRPVHYERRVVDTLLRLQQPDGLFYPGNGGGSCDDIDGIHPLVFSYHHNDHRRDEIRKALKRALTGIMNNRSMDGGFMWANRRYFSAKTYWNLLFKNLSQLDWYYWYYCNRKFFGRIYKFRGTVPIVTGWTNKHRTETDSSLFDTWLRCTAIAEICTVLTDEPLARVDWKFLKTPGLGWFDIPSHNKDTEAGPNRG